MTYGSRLKTAITQAKCGRKDLAAAIGISVQAIGDVINGKSNALTAENSAKAAAFLRVSSSWLATGEGEMLPRDLVSTNRVGGGLSIANTSPGPDVRGKVPLISWVQAGAWCQAVDLLQPGEAERWMDCPVSHSAGTFALRVRGDSMTAPHGNTRTYPEWCFIFVDPERREPVNGERVVACLSGTDEVTFKIYKNEDGRQWLQPLNPSHEPIREKFHIIGTVIGKWEDE